MGARKAHSIILYPLSNTQVVCQGNRFVLHATQKSCNAFVACNTNSCQPSANTLPPMFQASDIPYNIGQVISLAFPAQILIINSAIDESALLIAINLMKGYTMRKRFFGRLLLVVIIGITLGGCACSQPKMMAETTAPTPQPAVVQQAYTPPPAVVQPAPPPKQDRN